MYIYDILGKLGQNNTHRFHFSLKFKCSQEN